MGTDKFSLPDPAVVPQEFILPMLAQLAVLQSALAARLMLIHKNSQESTQTPAPDDGGLLTADQAAVFLGVTTHWMYRHASGLPFARRLSRKALRFSKAGLLRWRDSRRS
jgi:hypothetical protein